MTAEVAAGAGAADRPAALGARLFSFAVIADSHVEAEEAALLGEAGAGAGSNSRTNNRNRQIVRILNGLSPDFVVHLGDHVDTVAAQPSYSAAAASMKGVFRDLKVPLHLTPGNVDVGDKPVPWMPAAPVTPVSLAIYRAAFGPDRYAFSHAGCRFVVINSSLLNTGLDEEARQREWLEAELAATRGSRSFLFTHYPLFLAEPGEDGHYDNIDEPARSWLLGLIGTAGVEGVFAGHVHNFFYNRQGRTEHYVLPSTAFVRRDYSEMFRIGPADEAGRNDAEKVGFFMVDVHAAGHVAHFIRSRGITSDIDRAAMNGLLPGRPPHPKLLPLRPPGVDLRHAWCEVTSLPFTSPVDEFVRKRARNDYAIQALWDLGIRDLRVPLQDLRDDATRARMADLVAVGHRFTVFSPGMPTAWMRATLERHGHLVDAWEAVLPPAQFAAALPSLAGIADGAPFALHLSRLWSSSEEHRAAQRFRYHVVSGFSSGDEKMIAALLAGPAGRVVRGLSFRVGFEDDLLAEAAGIKSLMAPCRLARVISLSLAPSHPSDANRDKIATAHRVALAVMLGLGAPLTRIVLDTFAEVDRGYFVRLGLVDRRYNLAAPGRVWRTLSTALADLTPAARFAALADESGRICMIADGGCIHILLAAAHGVPRRPAASLPVLPGLGHQGRGRALDLHSGQAMPVEWHAAAAGPPRLALEPAIRSPWPILLTLPCS